MNGDWINVVDYLPPHGVDVLVCNDSGRDRRIASLCDAGWVPSGDASWKASHIMYWQSLPDDPIPTGPFYWARFSSGVALLYKKGCDDCAGLGLIPDKAACYLVDWLNRLWADK